MPSVNANRKHCKVHDIDYTTTQCPDCRRIWQKRYLNKKNGFCSKHNKEYSSRDCPDCKRECRERNKKFKMCNVHGIQYADWAEMCPECRKELPTPIRICEIHNIDYKNHRCPECSKEYGRKRREKTKSIESYCAIHDVSYFGLKCNKCAVISAKRSYNKRKGKNRVCKTHDISFTQTQCPECRREANKKPRMCKRHNVKYIGHCALCAAMKRNDRREEYNAKIRERLHNDVVFRLRMYIPSYVRIALKKNKGNKHKQSCWDKFGYRPDDLRKHIELQFESWMTWENWGVYDPATWDNNDFKTWKWQLDHLIPQADLPYDSMDHPNFKKCWALDNLRPLSAKQNITDGGSKIRHKKAA